MTLELNERFFRTSTLLQVKLKTIKVQFKRGADLQKMEKRPPLTFDSSLFYRFNDKLLLIITNIFGLACLFLFVIKTQFVVSYNRPIMIDDKHTCTGYAIKIKLQSC